MDYNALLQLNVLCHNISKWPEVHYVQAFMTLSQDPDLCQTYWMCLAKFSNPLAPVTFWITLPLPFSTFSIQIDQLRTPLHLLPLTSHLHVQLYLLYLLLLPHFLPIISNLYVIFQCLLIKGPFFTSHTRSGSVIITFWAQKRFCYMEKGQMGI